MVNTKQTIFGGCPEQTIIVYNRWLDNNEDMQCNMHEGKLLTLPQHIVEVIRMNLIRILPSTLQKRGGMKSLLKDFLHISLKELRRIYIYMYIF